MLSSTALPYLGAGQAGRGPQAFKILLPFATPFEESLPSQHPASSSRQGGLSPSTTHGVWDLGRGLGVEAEPSHLSGGAAERTSSSSSRGRRQSKYPPSYCFSFWKGVDMGVRLQLRRTPPCGEDIDSFCKTWFSISVPFGQLASKSGTFSLCSDGHLYHHDIIVISS